MKLIDNNFGILFIGPIMDPSDSRIAPRGEAEESGIQSYAHRVRVDSVRDTDGRYQVPTLQTE